MRSVVGMHAIVVFVMYLHFVWMQVKRLKQENKALHKTIGELKETIELLRSGHHDIRLEGTSQSDAETILRDCQSSPELQKQLQQHDASGTLAIFWKEQVVYLTHSPLTQTRSHTLSLSGGQGKDNGQAETMEPHCASLHAPSLGEDGGEKLPPLGEGKGTLGRWSGWSEVGLLTCLCQYQQVLCLPSKRHLLRERRKTASLGSCSPEIYKDFRRLVRHSRYRG